MLVTIFMLESKYYILVKKQEEGWAKHDILVPKK